MLSDQILPFVCPSRGKLPRKWKNSEWGKLGSKDLYWESNSKKPFNIITNDIHSLIVNSETNVLVNALQLKILTKWLQKCSALNEQSTVNSE